MESSLEEAQGDITPDVAVEINQDIVEPDRGSKQLRDVVVRLYLGHVWIKLQEDVGNIQDAEVE